MIITAGKMTFLDCNVGISTTPEVDFRIDEFTAIRTGTGIEVRGATPPNILQQLGLPTSTPPEIVIEALSILAGVREHPASARADALKETRLAKVLGVGADLASVAALLLSLLPK